MKDFVVIGCGRFGSSLALSLSELGKNVLCIDQNEEAIDKLASEVTHAVVADGGSESVLEDLGVHNMDCAVISISNNFEDSILATVACKKLGVPFVIVKSRNEEHAAIFRKLGADKTVVPERDMGQKLAHSLVSKNLVEYIELNEHMSLIEIRMPKAWEGKTLEALNVRKLYGVNIIAVMTDGAYLINPDPKKALPANSTIFVIGDNKGIQKVEHLADRD